MYETKATGRESGFDNDRPDALEQLRLLSEILDEDTFADLSEVGVAEGMRCWDIGSGAGSVAAWLADRVGATGSVLATDLKPDHMPEHPRLTAVSHDLTAERWPDPGFDLIHARLVLMHLAGRDDLAVRLVSRLRPGGALMLTDWFCDCAAGAVASPVDSHVWKLWQRYHDAVHDLGARTGMSLDWAARTADVLRAAGHEDVTVKLHRASGRGGGPSALLARLHTFMLEWHLVHGAGITAEELAVIRGNLVDPAFEMATYHTYTTIVRVPEGL